MGSHFKPIYHLIAAAAILAVCNSAEDGSTAEETSGRSIASSSSPSIPPVKIKVYYESLCHDSIQFVKNQLLPAYQDIGSYIIVTYVPYGKASHQRITDKNGVEKWHFTCQHGPSECYGNKAQACGLQEILTNPERTNKQLDQLNFVGCVMAARNPSVAVPECLERMGFDAESRSRVNACLSSATGDELLVANGEETFAVQPNINFVPTIIINGVFTHENQQNALRNFKNLICNHIPNNSRPATCSR